MKSIHITFLILASSLFSVCLSEQIEMPTSSCLASTEGLINSIVGNHVCAISGDFVDAQTDLIIAGPETLAIRRTYCSSDMFSSIFRAGWKLSEPDCLMAELSLNGTIASGRTAHGSYVKYSRNVSKHDVNPIHFNLVKLPGITNCHSEMISGRTNIKNNKLSINRDRHLISAKLVDSMGYQKVYKCPKYDDVILEFPLIEERSPRGNLKKYEYGKNTVKISSKNNSNNILYGSICFKGDDSTISAISSTTDQVDYKFKSFAFRKKGEKIKRDFLREVYSSQKPLIKYDYARNSHDYPVISSISNHNAAFLKIEYYEKGKNEVGARIVGKSDSANCIDRVKQLKTISGDGTFKNAYSFFYHFDQGNHKDNFTEVLDALSRRVDYFYTKEKRLQYLIKYKNGQPYIRETYMWGPNNSVDEGNLAGRYIQQEGGPILTGKVFYYDERGNVTHLRDYNFVNGSSTPELLINSDGKPPANNQAPYYLHRYIYHPESNLILSEHEANGKNIYYSYHGDTDLVASKILVYGDNQILLREFNDYDENSFHFRKVIDNGTSLDRHNHLGVTCMKVTNYKPRTSPPFGVPQQIDEMYRDCDTGIEHLMHRVINHHLPSGKLVKQDHYDSENQKLYTLEWEYNSHGLLTREVNALGQIIERKYDDFDRLVYEAGPNHGFYTTYQYDHADQLITKIEHHSEGQYYIRYKYDDVGNIIVTEDFQGNEKHYSYNDLNQVIRIDYPDSTFEEYDYNIFGKATFFRDRNGNVTRTSYNSQGSPLTIQYPDGTQESFEYYQEGTLAKKVLKNGSYNTFYRDCMGRVLEECFFDNQGQLLRKKSFLRNSFHLIEEVDAEGNSTHFEYDIAGRLVKKWDNHLKVSFEYDSSNRVNKEINWIASAEARVTVYVYDHSNRIIEQRSEDLNGHLFSITKNTYDCSGNLTSVISGDQITHSRFNTHGDPIEIIDPMGQVTHFDYDYNYYDGGETVVKVVDTDPLGNQTVRVKDLNGNVAKETCYNSFGVLLSKVIRIYSPLNELLLENRSRIIGGLEKGVVQTTWEYNSYSQLIKLIEAVGTKEQRVRRYHYNAIGQKCAFSKPDGINIEYDYDSSGRVKRMYSSDKTVDYHYEYNRNDQLIKVQDAILGTTSSKIYDSQRVLEETLANGLSVKYTYDNLNRKQAITLPDGSKIDYTYDAFYLRTVKHNDYFHHYNNFDINGNVLSSILPIDRGVISYQYDQLNRKIAIHHPSYKMVIPDDGYDPAGNLRTCFVNEKKSKYSYDDLYQLISEESVENHTYTFDSLKNRTQNDQVEVDYNDLNQPNTFGNLSLEYDLNGNLVRKGDHRFTYDALNRLIKSASQTLTTNYTYDYADRRLSKNEELFLYDGNNHIGVYENGLKCLRVLGDDRKAEIGAAVALEIRGKVLIPIHDHNGNIKTLLNTDGSIYKEYDYTAFGREINQSLGDPNPWRFSSKYFDSETGLIYFGRRYYDPEMGRWITTDPLDYEDGPNLYAYVQNNPLVSSDLWGLFTVPGPADLNKLSRNGSDLVTQPYQYETSVRHKSFSYNTSMFDNGLTDHPTLGFGFMNGINNTINDSYQSAQYLSQIIGYNVDVVYNSCHYDGSLGILSKLAESTVALNYYSTEPTNLVTAGWDKFFARTNGQGWYLQYCHSQGAIHVRNALVEYDPELRKRILVVGIAPAGYIDRRTCADVWHYRTRWDIVPYLDPDGAKRERGRTIFLKSHPEESHIGDHSFMSKTYAEVLSNQASRFIQNKR